MIPDKLSLTKYNRFIDIRDEKNLLDLSFEVSWRTVFNVCVIVWNLVSSLVLHLMGIFSMLIKCFWKIYLLGFCVPKWGKCYWKVEWLLIFCNSLILALKGKAATSVSLSPDLLNILQQLKPVISLFYACIDNCSEIKSWCSILIGWAISSNSTCMLIYIHMSGKLSRPGERQD